MKTTVTRKTHFTYPELKKEKKPTNFFCQYLNWEIQILIFDWKLNVVSVVSRSLIACIHSPLVANSNYYKKQDILQKGNLKNTLVHKKDPYFACQAQKSKQLSI